MTQTLPGADIHGYYAALGIQLPIRVRAADVNVRCFVDPDAHTHGDRTPSMSVHVVDGAYKCHGCGASGGAWDAAIAVGRSDHDAGELLVRYGIALPKSRPPRHRDSRYAQAAQRPHATPPPNPPASPRKLNTGHEELEVAHRRLLDDPLRRVHLHRTRGWSTATIRALGLGLDLRERITIPVHGPAGTLEAVLRYQPRARAKLLADPGSRRVLYPHPSYLRCDTVVLVEGEPDRIAAHSRGLPAIAIPGVSSWRAEWAALLHSRRVVVALDSDAEGRDCARRVAHDLAGIASEISVIDLDPRRDDGYDLTDWLLLRAGASSQLLRQLHELTR